MIFSDRRILASSRASRHASWKITGLWVVKTWSRIAGSPETIRKLQKARPGRLSKPAFVVLGVNRDHRTLAASPLTDVAL